ncbi:MAG: type II secretion system F family protein [Candidatus Dojkabacteria bacterium]|nr:MAG: type II secretion system F family protein [Candidatus Dojkabacteria bacterium]
MADKKLFSYVAVNANGERVKGNYSAGTKEEVVTMLFQKGLSPVSVDEVSRFLSLEKLQEINIGGVPLKDKMIFLKQFSIMLNAGLSITRALEVLSLQAQNPRFRQVLKEVLRAVSGGVQLSDSFAKYPDVFDSIAVNLIKAGEQSGNLGTILRKLSREYEQKNALRSKVMSALAYPAVLTVVMIGVVIFLMAVVVPQLQDAFVSFGADLPLITKIVIGISNFMTEFWYLLVLILIAAGVSLRYFLSTPEGRRVWDKFIITVPLFGPLFVKVQVATFSRVLYLLVSSGVPILQTLELTEATLSNVWFKDEVAAMRDQVKRGVSIAVPLLQSQYFPSLVGYMVNVGQETGQLDTVLRKVAKYYDLEIKSATSTLSSLLEPILLVVMGGVVAVIVSAIYYPMFTLTQSIK